MTQHLVYSVNNPFPPTRLQYPDQAVRLKVAHRGNFSPLKQIRDANNVH